MSANFTPELNSYTDLTPFRYWCQKVLPLVYDDSLSYYELLCKVIDYLNKTMEDVNLAVEDVGKLHDAYDSLQAYVNTYFENLDVQEEINNKLDEMVEDGTIRNIFSEDVQDILNVASDAAEQAIADIPENVTDWLEEHITQETGYVIDDTLTVQGAAADAKKTGDEISALKSDLTENDEYIALHEYVVIPFFVAGTGSGIRSTTGGLIENTTLSYTDYVNVVKYKKITYKRVATTLSTPTFGMAFYDRDKVYISGQRAASGRESVSYEDIELAVPDNAVYARFSVLNDTATHGQFSVSGESKLYNKINALENVDSELQNNLNAVDDLLAFDQNINIPFSIAGTGSGIRFATGELITNSALSYTDYVNVSKYANITYQRIMSTSSAPVFGMSFYDKDKVIVSGERAFVSRENTGYGEWTTTVPDNAVYARFSVLSDTETYGNFSLTGESKLYNKTKVDVSPFEKNVTFGSFSSDWYKGQGNDYSYFNSNTLYSEMVTRWDSLVANSKGYITRESIGTSSDNQTMYVYKMVPLRYKNNTGSTVPNNAPVFLIVPSLHGNEKSAAFGMYYLARDLVYDFDKNPVLNSIRTKAIVYVVPVGNPYGFDNKTRKNANGVDLNRNWGIDPEGITDPTSPYYPGAEPFDQPETQAIKSVIDNTVNLFYIVDYHTDGQYAATSWAEVNWMTYGYSVRYDSYYLNSYKASQFQIAETTENIQKEYNVDTGGESIGSITWGAEGAPRPTIVSYGKTEKNIMGLTFEGNNGLPSEESAYSSMEQKINSELIGNWIKNLFLVFKDAK